MNRETAAKKRNSPALISHVQTDKKDDEKRADLKKVFTHRNSVLTDLMEVNHLKSVYNINMAVCSLLFVNSVIFYLAVPDKFWQDITVLKWTFGKLSYFLVMWLLLHVYSFAVFEGFKLWIAVRNRIHSILLFQVADGIFLLLYISSIVLMYYTTASFTLGNKLPPITGISAAIEQVRISMKIHSFVRESVPRVTQYNPVKDGDQRHTLYPSRRHFVYYLFAPTLFYRDSYPRTETIHWKNAVYNLFKFACVIFCFYCLAMRFIIDLFKDVGMRPLARKELVLIFAGSMAAGAIVLLLIFYGLLHCWFNAFAELLKFGDRQFYQDWWNSTSFPQFYRRWNKVVHVWLHAYIYTDSLKIGWKKSNSIVLVFLVSGLGHEYVLSLAMGFCYPVVLVMYETFGVFLYFWTKEKTSQFWNIFMWLMLFTGWSILINFYSIEWYARVNCSKEGTSDFFIPKSWDLSCPVIKIF